MATSTTGAVPASISGLKSRDRGVGFAKSVDFLRINDFKRIKSHRIKVSVIRNSNPGPETVQLEQASEGSPLLGKTSMVFIILFFIMFIESLLGSIII